MKNRFLMIRRESVILVDFTSFYDFFHGSWVRLTWMGKSPEKIGAMVV